MGLATSRQGSQCFLRKVLNGVFQTVLFGFLTLVCNGINPGRGKRTCIEHVHVFKHFWRSTLVDSERPFSIPPLQPDCLVQCSNSRLPPESIMEGASSLLGEVLTVSKMSPCSKLAGFALEQETYSRLSATRPKRSFAPWALYQVIGSQHHPEEHRLEDAVCYSLDLFGCFCLWFAR